MTGKMLNFKQNADTKLNVWQGDEQGLACNLSKGWQNILKSKLNKKIFVILKNNI